MDLRMRDDESLSKIFPKITRKHAKFSIKPRFGRCLRGGTSDYIIFQNLQFCHHTSPTTITVSTHLNSTARQQQQPTILSPQMSSPGGPRHSSSRGSSPFFSACTGKSLENKVRWRCGKRKNNNDGCEEVSTSKLCCVYEW